MKAQSRRKWISLLLLVFLVFGLNRFGAGPLESAFYTMSRPFYRVFDYFGQRTSNFLNYFQSKKALEMERDALVLEKNYLLNRLTEKTDCLEEKDALAEMLQIVDTEHEWSLAMGRVTYANPAQDWALIDFGRRDGAEIGQPVVTSQRVLIGRISEIYESQARVRLLSHPDSLIKVRTVKHPMAIGFMQGRGGSRVGLQSTDIEQPFQQGDSLVTEAFRDEYPGGLLAGRIRQVDKDDVRSALEARVSPFYRAEDLRVVFIIKSF